MRLGRTVAPYKSRRHRRVEPEGVMKAYMVWPGTAHDFSDGCLLVFAHNRNEARMFAYVNGPWGFEYGYIDFSAIRRPAFDQYAKGDKPHAIETNDGLPDGVTFYEDGDWWEEGFAKSED